MTRPSEPEWQGGRAEACRPVTIAAALAGIAVAIYARLDDWWRGRR